MTTTVLLRDWDNNEFYHIINFKGYLNDEAIAEVQSVINDANDYFYNHCNEYGFLGSMYQTEYALHRLAEKYDFDEIPFDDVKMLYI